jgi:4-hydroxy-tetrahydrodipicolinate synthase
LIDSAEVRLPMTEVSAELARQLDREIERRAVRLCEERSDEAIQLS